MEPVLTLGRADYQLRVTMMMKRKSLTFES